jgi:hypothetical protein
VAALRGLLTPAPVLVLLALVSRTTYLVAVRPPFESAYWALADGLLSHRSLAIDGVTTTDFEPVYPLFLSVARVIARHHMFVVQLFQVAMASVGVVYVYRLATVLTGRPRLATIAGGLFALGPLLVRQAALPSDLALVSTLVVAFTYHFVAATTVRQMVTAGAWLGTAVLTRTMLAPLLVFAAAILFARRQWRLAFAMTLTTLVLVLPGLLATTGVHGSWRPTRSGLNLFIGNSRYTAALFPDHDPDLLQERANALVAAEVPNLAALSSQDAERVADRVLTRYALDYMAERPLRTFGEKLRNALYFFSPRLVPFHIAGPETRLAEREGKATVESAETRPLIEIVAYSVSYTPVLVAALFGVYLRRHHFRTDVMLYCVVATFTIVHALYFPATRYRAPVSFVLFFYAAVALDRWIERVHPD